MVAACSPSDSASSGGGTQRGGSAPGSAPPDAAAGLTGATGAGEAGAASAGGPNGTPPTGEDAAAAAGGGARGDDDGGDAGVGVSSAGANGDANGGVPGVDDAGAAASGDAAGTPREAGSGVSGGGDPFAANVVPTSSGGLWRFALGTVVFEVDASKGARVSTFSLAGHNVLADGSHFRPSPQKTWGWPPPPEIAQLPYTASVSGAIVTMESQTSARWGLKARKRFWANTANAVVTIEYTLTNTSSARASWAPWEVSRVNATGLTFFPQGDSISPKPASYGQLLTLQTVDGVSWLNYDSALYTSGNYIVARDGAEGWTAHAEAGVVFIKSYPDVPVAQIPPEEGEVQLWTDNTHTALEMETEGAYVPLAAGESLTWTMRWYLRSIPSTVAATAGSAPLADFVRQQIVK